MDNDTLSYDTNTYIALSMYGVLGVALIAANSMVLVLVYLNHNLRTPTNSCLVSLAVSDLSTGLVAIPCIIACTLTIQQATCIVMDVFVRFLAFSTVAHLTVLTFERYVRITKPFVYRSRVTTSTVRRVICGVWCFSLAGSLSQLIWNTNNSISPQDMLKIDIIYDSISFAITVVVPLGVISAMYIAIFKYIRNNNIKRSKVTNNTRQKRTKRGEKRLLLVFLAMIVVFIFGSCMYFTCTLILDWSEYHDIRLFTRVYRDVFVTSTMFFRFFSSLCNPLLLTYFKQDFYTAGKSLFTRQ